MTAVGRVLSGMGCILLFPLARRRRSCHIVVSKSHGKNKRWYLIKGRRQCLKRTDTDFIMTERPPENNLLDVNYTANEVLNVLFNEADIPSEGCHLE